MFFTNKKRFLLFLATIGMGVPVWFVPGVLIFFTPEIGVALGVTEPVKAGQAIIVAYSAGVFGCLLSGWSSQQVHSRKFVIGFFVVGIGILDLILLNAQGISSTVYYTLIGGLGFGMGYWTLLLTTTAELFGTNLRVTATSSVANFVRGSTLLSTFLIDVFKPDFGFLHSLIFVAIIGLALAFSSLWKLPETFGRDLDFIEK